MDDIAVIADTLHSAHNVLVESELIRIIEIIEGRVPSRDELMRHGVRKLFYDGRAEWHWRGRCIVTEHPLEFSDGKVNLRVES